MMMGTTMAAARSPLLIPPEVVIELVVPAAVVGFEEVPAVSAVELAGLEGESWVVRAT